MEIFVKQSAYGRGRWAFRGLRPMFRKPSGRQQLPQLVREPVRWPVRPPPFQDFVHNGHIPRVVERITTRDNLHKKTYDDLMYDNGCSEALTSRIVIPNAYVSVLLEGSSFWYSLVKPNSSGCISSGAIHRRVPLIPRLLAVDSSTMTASPKSAKRARQLESIRIFAYQCSTSV